MRDEAAQRLEQARATLADAKKGKRPTEIDSLLAQLKQAQDKKDAKERQQAGIESFGEEGYINSCINNDHDSGMKLRSKNKVEKPVNNRNPELTVSEEDDNE